jgi:zinc protease
MIDSMKEAKTIQIPFLTQSDGTETEGAKVVTYENGYTFVFVPKKGDVFNISTWVKTGSIHEDDQINGISHFLEHLMFKGTERFKPGEFDRAMESMGAIINAATWKDFTFYYVTGPKGKAAEGETGENFDLALDMHSDMMLGSTIPDEEVGPPYDPFDPNYKGEKRERSVVIEEISMREDQPWTKIYNAVNHMMYPAGHPYQRDVIGTRAIIGQVPRDTIYDYYRTWYSPTNLTTIVVGDFHFGHLEEKIRRAFDFERFGIQPNGKKPLAPYPTQSVTTGERYVELKGDYQTSFFIMGYHGPSPEDLEATIAMDVVSHVLGEGRSSRLTQALLEKPAVPVYNYVGTDQSTFKLGNVFFVQGNFTSDDTRGTLQQLETEIEKLLTSEPITEEEFQRAVKKLKVNFAATSETASGIAETIGEALTVCGSLDSYLKYLDVLAQLTVDKVNEVARRYLTRDKAFLAVMTPEEASGKA